MSNILGETVKGSRAYQLSRKIELLKKKIKIWKKSCYDKEFHVIENNKRDIAITQPHVVNNPFIVFGWQQVEQIKSQLGRTFID